MLILPFILPKLKLKLKLNFFTYKNIFIPTHEHQIVQNSKQEVARRLVINSIPPIYKKTIIYNLPTVINFGWRFISTSFIIIIIK